MNKSASKAIIQLIIVLVITFSFLVTAWAQDTTFFTLDSYQGTSLTYRLIANGSVETQTDNEVTSTTSFSLHSTLELDIAQWADQDDMIPFTGKLRVVDSQGLGLDAQFDTESLSGHISPRGSLSAVTTPDILTQNGLFLDDLLLGLIVPAPDRDVASDGSQWQALFPRYQYRPHDFTLTATYMSQGASEWGFRSLPSVTGRFRSDTSFRTDGIRNLVQEIGHGIFYVQPSGIVEMSSVSLIVTTETLSSGGTTRVKTTLTTTLELVDLHRSAQADRPIDPIPADAPQEPDLDLQPIESPSLPALDELPAPSDMSMDPLDSVDVVDEVDQGDTAEAVEPEDFTASPEPVPGSADEPQVDTGQPSDVFVYKDPAQRFELTLDQRWHVSPVHLTLRGTHLISPSTGEEAYIYVMPLPSPAATAASIARSALATYGETLPGFSVLTEPQPEFVGGDLAYVASYQYVDDRGQAINEWALFTRKRDRAYYLEYAPGPQRSDSGLQGLMELRDGFVFGPEPNGLIAADTLQESLRLYTNYDHQFRLLIPSLWPLTESADGGSSTTFTEIGERGYLTVFVDRGAQGITTSQVLTAWKDQWSSEPDFTLDQDVSDAQLGPYAGATFTYSWRGPADQFWTRRVHGAIVDHQFYVVVIDYRSDGYLERASIFDSILASFNIVSPADDTESKEIDAPIDEPTDETPEEAGPVPMTPPPFDEPSSDSSVLLLGRILTRYPGADGRMVDQWGSYLDVTVLANQQEYRGVTDDRGYVYVANLPPISGDRSYTILRIDGAMLGFTDDVTVSFDNLLASLNTPRVSHLRTVIITLERDHTLSVDIVRHPASAPDEPTAPEYFLNRFGDSAWTPYVDEMVRQGLE